MKRAIINDTDPIVPGISAAGLEIGAGEETLPIGHASTNKIANVYGYKRYIYINVIALIKFGIVSSIILQGTYRGKFLDKIGIGSGWTDIVNDFGPLVELECDDVFALRDYPGTQFEFDSPNNPRLTHIIVQRMIE